MISPGDTVTVVRSPYSSVRNGTRLVVEHVRREHLGKRDLCYLAGLANKAFWDCELKKEEE